MPRTRFRRPGCASRPPRPSPSWAEAFLSAAVTRIAITVLRSARVRREEYVGPWFPEPLLTDPYSDPERSVELADSLSMAALLPLEMLAREMGLTRPGDRRPSLPRD